MFRLIAIMLVLAFALLGMLGNDQPSAYQSAAMLMSSDARRTDSRIGDHVTLRVPAGLFPDPQRRGAPLASLGRGASVVMLSAGLNGVVRVRDDQGRVGYVPAMALAAAD